MKNISIPFQKGSADIPSFNNKNITLTSGGRVSYARNINFEHSLLPVGVPTVGPLFAVNGVYASDKYATAWDIGRVSGNASTYFLGTRINSGTTAYILRVNSLTTNTITQTITFSTSGMSGSYPIIQKLVFTEITGSVYKIYTMVRHTDGGGNSIGWYEYNHNTSTSTLIKNFTGLLGNSEVTDMLLGKDNKMYFAFGYELWMYDPATGAATTNVINIPATYRIQGLAKWQNFLVIIAIGEEGGMEGFLWDYVSPTYNTRVASIPIETLQEFCNDNSGNLYIFGSNSNSNANCIYVFTGYGFRLLKEYNDYPPSGGSGKYQATCAAAGGFIYWTSNTGEVLRYCSKNNNISLLVTPYITTTNGYGNITIPYQGSNGIGIFSTYVYDSNASNSLVFESNTLVTDIQRGSPLFDNTNQYPQIISGLISINKKSVLRRWIIQLKKPISQGKEIEVTKWYINSSGELTGSFLTTLTADSNTYDNTFYIRVCDYEVSNFALGLLFKIPSTAVADPFPVQPQAVLSASVDYEELSVY